MFFIPDHFAVGNIDETNRRVQELQALSFDLKQKQSQKKPASPSAENITPHVLWMNSSALPDIDHQSRVVGEIMSFTGH